MYALLLLTLSTALVGDDAAVFKAGTDQEVLQAIAKGYVDNRECVERCKASFVVIEGRAPNLETARRGELEDPVKAKGAYLFDGSKKKYEQLYDRERTISHTVPEGKFAGECQFVSVQLLSDGSSTLMYAPSYNPFAKAFDKHAVIDKAEKTHFTEFGSFLLNLGVKEPHVNGVAESLEQARNHVMGLKDVKLRRDVPFDGRKVHVLTFEYEGGDATYWIDYERGCIPLRILSRTDKDGDYDDERYEKVSLVGGKLWFPARRVIYNRLTRRVRIFEVDEIQIDAPIADAEFQLSFFEPIGILDVVHSLSYKNAPFFPSSWLGRPNLAASRPVHIRSR